MDRLIIFWDCTVFSLLSGQIYPSGFVKNSCKVSGVAFEVRAVACLWLLLNWSLAVEDVIATYQLHGKLSVLQCNAYHAGIDISAVLACLWFWQSHSLEERFLWADSCLHLPLGLVQGEWVIPLSWLHYTPHCIAKTLVFPKGTVQPALYEFLQECICSCVVMGLNNDFILWNSLSGTPSSPVKHI